MSVKSLMHWIGTEVDVPIEISMKISVRCRVQDVRNNFGRTDMLVIPIRPPEVAFNLDEAWPLEEGEGRWVKSWTPIPTREEETQDDRESKPDNQP